MSGDKILRHIAAALVFSLFLMTVILGIGLYDPYALVTLVFFSPVGLIAGGLVWGLAFSDMPLLSKIIRFSLYILLCILTGAAGFASSTALLANVFFTMIFPPLGMLLFAWVFPTAKKAEATEPSEDASAIVAGTRHAIAPPPAPHPVEEVKPD